MPLVVFTNRGALGVFSLSMTARARFSWAVSVLPSCAGSLGGVGPHCPPRSRVLLGVQDRFILTFGSFSMLRRSFG